MSKDKVHTALLKRLISIGEWLKMKSVFKVLVIHWMHLIVRWSFLSDNDEDDKENQSLNMQHFHIYTPFHSALILGKLNNVINVQGNPWEVKG